MLVIGLVWDSARKRARAQLRVRRVARGPALGVIVAAACGAAAVHAAVVPEHAREWVGYAVFFAVTALVQVAGALVIFVRRTRLLCLLFALANAAVIVLWLVSRLVAVPLGPGAGDVEPFGALDVVASACEALIVVASVNCLWRTRIAGRRIPTPPAVLTSAAHG